MRVERDGLRVTDAAALLGLKRRQVYRLLDRLRKDCAEGLISRKRYADFGPTFAREYLVERHDIQVSWEALRQMMIGAGLWKDLDARRPRPYSPVTGGIVVAN